MTTFERELVRAIEHGCPECGSNELTWYQLQEERCYLSVRPDGELDTGFPEATEANAPKVIEVECQDCYATLWRTGDGWIPELKEVVESD